MTRLIRMILTTAVIVAAHGPARADALQSELLARMKATPADRYAFRRTIANEATGQPRRVQVEQYDPRRAPADRWSLVSIDGRAPDAKELARARKARRAPAAGYARLAEWFGAPAVRSDAGPGHVLYRFARLPAGTVKMGSRDASSDLRAEALVNTAGRVPFVERVRFATVRAFRIMLVASVKSMTVDSRYRMLPDGMVVPGDTDSLATGSMMGKEGQIRTRIGHDGFERVR